MKIMKHTLGLMLLLAVVGLMMACSKTAKEDASDETTEQKAAPADEAAKIDSVSMAEEVEAAVAEEEMEGQDGTEMNRMAGNWNKLPLTVYPTAEKANIQDFAKAFCRQYNKYLPNVIILKFVGDPKKFNQDAEHCFVTSDIPNGFLRLGMANQYDQFTEMCYWKRPNGHSLVGTYMRHETEGDFSESAFMFYDYDPATKVMTPDMEVYGIVEKAVQEGNFDDYILRLPQKGKDIELSMYKDNGDGGCEPTEWMLKWTGNSFKLVK